MRKMGRRFWVFAIYLYKVDAREAGLVDMANEGGKETRNE